MTAATPISGVDTTGILLTRDDGFAGTSAPNLSSVVEAILKAVEERVLNQRWPAATYRVQFNRDFTFQHATDLVRYWHDLGISDCYASPYLKANSGSRHGYDIVDHSQLNPELGTESDFRAFVAELQKHGMCQVQDFVPNHMGIGGNENLWFQDVLENGPCSAFSGYFDIDWQPLKTDLEFKVLLPVLGSQFGQALENQELRLEFGHGTFHLHYYDRCFPIAPRSYELILRHRFDELAGNPAVSGTVLDEFHSILTAILHLPQRHEITAEKREERAREKEVIKRRIQRLCDESCEIQTFIADNVRIFNGQSGEPSSFHLLDQLLQQQAYRLSLWRVASDEINYRRFFDVNELAAICMEKPEVFEATHRLPLHLLESGQVNGLRIDHADGLFDPTAYLWRLQSARFLQLCRYEFESTYSGLSDLSWVDLEPVLLQRFVDLRAAHAKSPLLEPVYLIVEKILGSDERLPDDWPIHGSTGYEFLNCLNGLFVDGRKVRQLDAVCAKFTSPGQDF